MNRILAGAVTLLACAFVAAPTLAATTPAPGGANQRSATEGCVNQWLFNGIWRLKVDSVEPLSSPDMAGFFGWGVTVDVRNGTQRTDYYLSYTGLESIVLAFPDDTTLDVNTTTTGALDAQKLTFHVFPQGAGFKHRLQFWYPYGTKQSEVQKPTKFLMSIDPKVQQNHASGGHPQYTTKSPSFRVHLDCTK